MKNIVQLFLCLTLTLHLNAQTKTVIHFDSNKNELSPFSFRLLDSICQFIKPISNYTITVNGYCDNTGNENDNQVLSEKRAQIIINYLKNAGLNIATISGKGFSADHPVASNMNEEGKAKNRRAEILITIKKQEPVVVIEPLKPKQEEPVKLKKTEVLSDTSSSNSLDVGNILVLKNLNFEGGTAKLLPESKPSLKTLLKLLKDNPTMEIEIEGHVCCANDMPLSVDRALTVLEYLVRNGIHENRLKYAGHSNYNPIASEINEEGRIQNRRVEIMILKK